ncbi:MAG: c-type cytochrome [Curvibacter sp.]|nr:c-type cytochrome [Curvibacter sp.]
MKRWILVSAVGALALAGAWAGGVVAQSPIPLSLWKEHPLTSWSLARGDNPNPVTLQRPRSEPLSAMAQLGRKLFFDPSLSGSGKQSCASCHVPDHGYAPANKLSVQLGGGDMQSSGARAVPSLTYLHQHPVFNIGPAVDDDQGITLQQLIAKGSGTPRTGKTAQGTAQSAQAIVPVGGLFWDGRANTLQQQADGPLFNPVEMDGGSPAKVADKLRHASYAGDFAPLFGPGILGNPSMLLSEALFALARYQIEDPSFHPYDSQYDAWLEGKARFTPEQLRGYLAFNDPAKGNCAACHVAQPSRDGFPPLFTDSQYEALGVPRNPDIPANRDPAYHDLGLCGPFRSDLQDQPQYCGMFLTPTLRNVSTRQAYFHNGLYHSLDEVMAFYRLRDTDPAKVYPLGPDGKPQVFNDLPTRYRANIDHTDAPFDRKAGDTPALSEQEAQDIIAFLRTLSDGYKP